MVVHFREMNKNQILAVYRPIVEFGGYYLVLGIFTIVVAAVLLRNREAHDAIQALVLFVCTIVVGTRIVWTVWCVAQPGTLGGACFPDWYGIQQAKAVSLKVAWAFMALSGHYFIMASGQLCRHWKRASHRIAVLFCALTMCVGLVGAWQCYMRWHEWFMAEMEQMAVNLEATLNLTDEVTAQMALETPDDWSVLVARGHYLMNVGRLREGGQVLTQALNCVPEDKNAIRKGIIAEIERTTPRLRLLREL